MTLKQLQYLVKIVECNSITAAAKELSVSQPGITKAILSLEEEYGIHIFDRKSHGVQLTPEGREFVHYARGVIGAVNALHDCAENSTSAKKRLSVGTQQLDFIYPLIDTCYKLCRQNDLYFNLVETERNDVVRQVLDGQVDLGLVVRTRDDEKDFLLNREARRLETHVIDSGSCAVAVGPGCALWGQKSVHMEDVVLLTQIALDMENQAKEAFWSNQRRYSYFGAKHVIFCNTISACEHFLLHTDAVAFTSAWTRGCFKDPGIQIVPVEETENMQELLWLKRAAEPLSPTERYFLQLVYEFLGKPAPQSLSSDLPENPDINTGEKNSI